MKCNEMENLLSVYIDEEVTVEEKEIVESHLLTCSCCQKELAELERVKALMGSLDMIEPPDQFHEQLLQTIAREREQTSHVISLAEHQKRKSLFRGWNKKWSLAAMVASLTLFLSISFAQIAHFMPQIASPGKTDQQDVTSMIPRTQTDKADSNLIDNKGAVGTGEELNKPVSGSGSDRNLPAVSSKHTGGEINRVSGEKTSIKTNTGQESLPNKEVSNKIIRSVNLLIAVPDLKALMDTSTQEDTSHIATTGALNYTLSVPNDLMPGMVDELEKKGTVVTHKISEQDITAEYNNALAEKERLQQQKALSTDVEQIGELEKKIEAVNAKIAKMNEQTSKTTINVKMEEAK